MKRYYIMAFRKYGIFVCKEEWQDNGDILLIGKFEGKSKKYTFIKHSQDIEIK